MPSNASYPLEPRHATATVGERERERVVRRLGDHFAQEHLTLEEYEFRVQAALRATQWYELTATTNDLPALAEDGPAIAATASATTLGVRQRLVALMGGVTRKGRWLVPPQLRATAIMGGVVIDLRDATFTEAVTDIYALSVMGGIEVIVPPGVRIESEGIAIMGGFDDQPGFSALAGDAAPVVRVRGVACMGGVVTKMVPRGWELEDDA